MFDTLLIANRGEIAARIIRTANAMGLRTVLVASTPDLQSLAAQMADDVVHLEGLTAAETYLRADLILEAARQTGAGAIHPGYGFLSENAAFAAACKEAGIVFVGPPASAITAMGLKDAAKALMEKAGVPVVPGYHGCEQDEAFLSGEADRIGYPVLIKAVAGGGGKGMRKVAAHDDFAAALVSARREAEKSFGDPRVLIERYVSAPRHVEIQVFADSHGNCVHLFERDCSLQRRHQKVVEEAPAPGMPLAVREAMGQAAVAAAKAVGYVGAGTVEFIADGSRGLSADGFFFMEMNTRLQVEHPVTEAITGLDLVEWQIRVAQGEALPLGQDDLAIDGHAMEVRLYAENPLNGFLPATGCLSALSLAEGEGIRVDAGVSEGDTITPFYDPMIAKVIAHGATREEAMARLDAALCDSVIAGLDTNAGFLVQLLRDEHFRQGDFDTGLIERKLDELLKGARATRAATAFGALRLLERKREESGNHDWASPFDQPSGFRLMPEAPQTLAVTVDGQNETITAFWSNEGLSVAYRGAEPAFRPGGDGATYIDLADEVIVLEAGRQVRIGWPAYTIDDEEGGGDEAHSPMTGRVVEISVAAGTAVAKGDRLFIVEAMKMEHSVLAPRDGIIASVNAVAGGQVDKGAVILTLEPQA